MRPSHVTFRAPDDLRAALDAEARSWGSGSRSRTSVILAALRAFLTDRHASKLRPVP